MADIADMADCTEKKNLCVLFPRKDTTPRETRRAVNTEHSSHLLQCIANTVAKSSRVNPTSAVVVAKRVKKQTVTKVKFPGQRYHFGFG